MPNPRNPRIEITELREDFIRFILSDTDASVANALRRIIISGVGTIACYTSVSYLLLNKM